MVRKLLRIKPSPVGGVCEGLGEYSDTDPVIWRLLFIFGSIFTIFPFLLTYIIMWIVLPLKKDDIIQE